MDGYSETKRPEKRDSPVQYCFADESLAGVYHTAQSDLLINISAESHDFAATLFSKSLNVARQKLVRVVGE